MYDSPSRPQRFCAALAALTILLAALFTGIPVSAAGEAAPLGGWTSPHHSFTADDSGKVSLTSTGDNNFVLSDTRVTAFTMEADMTVEPWCDGAGFMFAVENRDDPGSSWGALHLHAAQIRAFHVPDLDKLDKSEGMDPSIREKKVHVKLTMDAAGNLRAYLNDAAQPALSVNYPGYQGGYLGLCTWVGGASFENITYTEAPQVGFVSNVAGWSAASGDWTLTDSGYRANNPALGNTYAFSSEVIPTGQNFVFSADLHIEVPEGGGGAGIAIVPNTANPNETWYCANIDKMWGNTARLFKNRYPGGDFWSIGRSLTAEETQAKDYAMRIEYTDGVFSYYLGGTLVDSYEGDNFTGGTVSLMTFNSDTTFQNVSITYSEPAEPSGALTGWSGGSFEGGEGADPVIMKNTGGNNFTMSAVSGKYFTMEADVALDENCEAAGFLFGVPNRENPGSDWCALQINNYHANGKARVFNVPHLDELDQDGVLEPGTRDKPFHLKLTVSPGNIIRVYVGNSADPVVETTYSGYAGGYLGLCTYNGSATFSNITWRESEEPVFNTNLTGWKEEGSWGITNKGFRGDNASVGNAFSFSDVAIPAGASFILEGDMHVETDKGGGGLVIAQNPANPVETWYCANVDKYGGNTARLFKNNGADVWTINGGLTAGQISAKDYHLRIECIGGVFSYYLDGVLIGTESDADFNGGTIGLMTYHADATFDNVYFYLAEDIPQLTGLTLVGGQFNEPFDPATASYTANVASDVSSVRLRAEAKERFTLKLNNTPLESGAESADIPLRVGKNVVNLTVSDAETKLSLPIEITIFRAVDEETIYEGGYRPQFHFTPQTMWMNDPNGLIYNADTGEYHMYYQYNPESLDWGTPHWGHAVSKDLIHWTDYGIVLSGSVCSGGGVIDYYNDSGLFDESVPPASRMIFFFNDLQYAYSTDGGYTLQRVTKPWLPGVADPKVVWYPDPALGKHGGIWLAITGGQGNLCSLYTSEDLINWTLDSYALDKVGNTMETECPDLYPLPLDGNENDVKWVLNAGGVFYVVGDITKDAEGKLHFRAETDELIYNGDSRWSSGTASGLNYATTTYFNDPLSRRISVSWLIDGSAAALGTQKCWNGVQTLPLETRLQTVNGQMTLTSYPVAEVSSLRSDILYETENASVAPASPNLLDGVTGAYYDIEATFTPDGADEFGFILRKGGEQQTVVKYSTADNLLIVDKSKGGKATSGICQMALRPLDNGKITMRILVDTSVIEAFGNDGEAAVSTLFFPDPENVGMEFFTAGGNVNVDRLSIYAMSSAWKAQQPQPVPTTLTGLSLSSGALSPAFDTNVTEYTASVAHSVSSLKVIPTYTGDTPVTVNGIPVASGASSADIDLLVGDNTITVTAGEKTYSILVSREDKEDPPIVGETPFLDGLELSKGTLTPTFDKEVRDYTASVGHDVSSIQVKPFFSGDMTVTVGGKAVESGVYSEAIALREGANTIEVKLILGEKENTYTIVVTRAAAEETTKPATGKPSIPGGTGSDWKWPEGNGSSTTGKDNPQSGDASALPLAAVLLAGAIGTVAYLTRKKK